MTHGRIRIHFVFYRACFTALSARAARQSYTPFFRMAWPYYLIRYGSWILFIRFLPLCRCCGGVTQIKEQWRNRYFAALEGLKDQIKHIIKTKGEQLHSKPLWFWNATTEAQVHCVMWQQLINANPDISGSLPLPGLQVTCLSPVVVTCGCPTVILCLYYVTHLHSIEFGWKTQGGVSFGHASSVGGKRQ